MTATAPSTDRTMCADAKGIAERAPPTADLNHAGIPFLGHHTRVTPHGRNVGIVFAPVWAVATVLNALAFSASLPN